ncbi:hypothetical protein DMA11_11755 [Marinilabiliaceae bacterium JC017]|nr:hypothetical protein DMA11_11755 [Marinilabiliaceae bacterium JC017]
MELTLQIILTFASGLGVLIYFSAFYIAHKNKKNIPPEKAKNLYYLSGITALIWYIPPFLSQPRFLSLWNSREWSPETIPGAFMNLLGLYLVIQFFFIWGIKSSRQNMQTVKKNFYTPSSLLSAGFYQKVRHPMLSADIMTHLGLCLLTGAIYSLWLFPFYLLWNFLMMKIEEKYVLFRFRIEYQSYKERVPALFNIYIKVLLGLSALTIIINAVYNN